MAAAEPFCSSSCCYLSCDDCLDCGRCQGDDDEDEEVTMADPAVSVISLPLDPTQQTRGGPGRRYGEQLARSILMR